MRRFLARQRVVPTELVVAVSGGPDSVALLRALHAAGAGRLVVAHLNHRLRGAESDADEAFVGALASALAGRGACRVEVHCAALDVGALARQEGANLEAVARTARYRWLTEVARVHQAHWVATGHTAGDQAETVLHRLLRGAGLQGLRGIAARRRADEALPPVHVIRPLLGVSRREVLAYLEELGQDYREDRTNQDLERARNRIRHELIPYLEQHFNPGLAGVLGRLAVQAEEAFQLEQGQAARLLGRAELPRAGQVLVFDRDVLREVTRPEIRSLFRLVWGREGWPVDAMSFNAWEALTDVALDGPPAVDLPGPIHARRRERVLQIEPRLDGARAHEDAE